MSDQPTFDHEKLDVYQVELAFIGWATTLLTEVRNAASGFHREVCDQFDRASLSTLLNTAEGNGKRQGKQPRSSLTMPAARQSSARDVWMLW